MSNAPLFLLACPMLGILLYTGIAALRNPGNEQQENRKVTETLFPCFDLILGKLVSAKSGVGGAEPLVGGRYSYWYCCVIPSSPTERGQMFVSFSLARILLDDVLLVDVDEHHILLNIC